MCKALARHQHFEKLRMAELIDLESREKETQAAMVL
jgi:hypothetical protein